MKIALGKMAEVHLGGQHGGVAKLRPVVVIDGRIDFDHGDEVEVAVITTSNNDRNGVYIPVPWDPQGRCCTKLDSQSWACAHWIVLVPVEDLDINEYGYCPVSVIRTVREQVGVLRAARRSK
jgi:hypothetical protein